MIKAVFFDMNGIIIDDEHIHELAFRKTVKPFGISLSHKDYLKCCAGKTDKDGYLSISEEFSIKLPVVELLNKKSAMYLKLFPENKKSYNGIIDLIEKLSKDFDLALTSSSSRAEVDLITKEFGIKQYFKVTISSDEVINGKPDPEPYLITAKLLGIKTQESVVIEDSKNGVLSAKAAGCYCIAVTTTRDKKSLENSDLIVSDFSKINKKVIKQLEK